MAVRLPEVWREHRYSVNTDPKRAFQIQTNKEPPHSLTEV